MTRILLAGCASTSPTAVTYFETKPFTDQLLLWMTGCNANAQVSAEESPTAIHLKVTAPNREDGCDDYVIVLLDAPVGDRALIDEATGKELT